MSYIYALSDIHGHYEPMLASLEKVDLNTRENKLIFLGDYVDGGSDSCKVLYHIYGLQKKHPKQVTVLLGNHDEKFIEWYYSKTDDLQWLSQKESLHTLKSFITEKLLYESIDSKKVHDNYDAAGHRLKNMLSHKHHELMQWLQQLYKFNRYVETEGQIFVHAGIMEEAEELWKHGTPDHYFTEKYPPQMGSFYKDIIAGHISTADIAKDKKYLGKIYWDKENHYYIDGEVSSSNTIPVLKYDTETTVYSGYEKRI